MFFTISKIIGFLATPFFWIVLLLLIAAIRRKKGPALAAGFLLLVFSNSFILDEVMRTWEVKPVHIDTLEQDYDAGIVLSGMVSYDQTLERIGFHENIDRMLQAVDLYRKNYIRKIFISGGSGSLSDDTKEAEILRDYFADLGLPYDDILIESESRNTHENAAYTADYMRSHIPGGKFLLITSASHMRRAIACFEKEGLSVTPFVSNRHAGERKYYPDHLLLPNADALTGWNRLTHEWVGYAVYALAGYL